MQIGICGASKFSSTLDKKIPYIAVDGGFDTALEQGIIPVYVVGDFDSIKNRESISDFQTKILPCRKDITDTEYAITYAIEQGYDEIYLYGVTGGRLDHFMAIICLLQKYQQCKLYIVDDQNIIQLLDNKKQIVDCLGYTYFSLFALEDTCISIESAKYPLVNYILSSSDPLCVSNEPVNNQCIITNDKPILFVLSKEPS